MSYMLKEIKEQPIVIHKMVKNNLEVIKKICEKIKKYDIRFIEFLARGSSDNACMFGRYFMGYLVGIPTGLLAPSLFSLYNSKFNLKNILVFGVSQSGETPEILEVLAKSRKYGAYTIGITNVVNSTISKIAEDVIYLHAGKEKAVPATKTYTAQLSAFYLIGFVLQNNKIMIEKLKTMVPKYITKTLSLEPFIANIAERYRFVNSMLILSRGLNYATALETALKIKETCYIKAEALSTSDFLHGPIAIVKEDLPIIVYASQDPTFDHIYKVVNRIIKEYNAETIVVSSNHKILNLSKIKVPLPGTIDPIFSPIVNIIVGQLLAYYIAKVKNINPDNPRGLKKITLE